MYTFCGDENPLFSRPLFSRPSPEGVSNIIDIWKFRTKKSPFAYRTSLLLIRSINENPFLLISRGDTFLFKNLKISKNHKKSKSCVDLKFEFPTRPSICCISIDFPLQTQREINGNPANRWSHEKL